MTMAGACEETVREAGPARRRTTSLPRAGSGAAALILMVLSAGKKNNP